MRNYELLTAQGGGSQEEGEETEDLSPGSVPGELPDAPEPGTLPQEPDVTAPEPETPEDPERL